VSRRRTLGIAGVGLIGASIGLRAAAAGWEVHGWDPNAGHLAAARARGAIAWAEPDLRTLGEFETLVIAAPLDATLALLAGFASGPPRAALIIDVASLKAPVAAAGRDLVAFVATHPIAGSERSGPGAAEPGLFAGRVWTYDAAARPGPAARARDFITEMGARAVAIDSREHDRIVALTSHLPQLVAVALGARLESRLDEPNVADLCGTGMGSMLRLGGSAWPMWQAIFAVNGRAVAQEVRGLASVLVSLAENLDADRPDDLAAAFTAAAAAVARLRLHGTRPSCVEHSTNVMDERY